jgi:23S rRNA (uracil1939-C5)-methyltransferase
MGRTLRAGETPLTVIQCAHAAECAGCPLIHLDYAQQLSSKRARVVTAMSHYPALELLYTRPVTPAEPIVGYRGRAKLIVSADGRIGLYARTGNHEVVDIPQCRVLTPAIAEVVAKLRELCASPPGEARALLLPYNAFGGGILRAIDLREVRLATPTPFLDTRPSAEPSAAAPTTTTEAPKSPPTVEDIIPGVAPSSRSKPGSSKRAIIKRTSPASGAKPRVDALLPPKPEPIAPRAAASAAPVAATDASAASGQNAPASHAQPAEPERIGVLLTFVLQRDRAPTREELKEAARALRPLLPRVVGIAANFHDGDAPQILGPDTLPLDGAMRAQDRIGTVFHLATFGSFVQAHRDQAARVHAIIAGEIASLDLQGPDESAPHGAIPRVLDLYGGSGAISIALARSGCHVTMVESFAPATLNARTAAEAQGLRIDVRTGDVAEVVTAMADAGQTFDAVVMNPPRRGVSPAAREAVARLGAPLCIYVSCEPDTLARDLDHLSRLGYGASEMVPFDMIPLTDEVETVCVLRRSPPVPPRVIYEDEDILVVDKGPHEPVGQDDSYYPSSLLVRCTRIRGTADDQLEPVHLLDAGTSGLCMLARNEEARAAWANAMTTTGRLIYLAAAKSITPAKGAITRDLREGGRSYPARTRYRRLAIASGHSILRVIPDGGRTHQIRRHLAAIGHPVIGDERYGHLPTNRYFEEKHGLDRSFLHLVRIEVAHPRTGARLLIESTLPGDLRSALERATGSSVLRFLEQKHALGDARSSSIPPPAPEDGVGPVSQEGPTSSRGSVYPGDEIAATDSLRMPMSQVSVPDLDESPRTIRRTIVSSDED